MEKEKADTISDAGLEPEEYLAVHIGGNFTSKTVSNDSVRTKDSEVWFFQVADVVELSRERLTLNDDQGTDVGPIDPQAGTDYQQLYDDQGSDVLRNDDNPWRVYHFSVGVKQDDLRVYPRIPENQNGGGWAYLSGSQPDPEAGEDFGYVHGGETSYDDPSVKLESLAWNVGTRSVHQYGFYNDNKDLRLDPILSVKGYAYELRPVEEEDEMLNLLADLGRPAGRQENRIKMVSFSRTALRTFSFSVPSSWSDAENALNISQVNLPENIEEQLEEGQN